MEEREEKVIERVFDDALEKVWEEARIRDLMTLLHMWQNGALGIFTSFDDFYRKFDGYDETVRNMEKMKYFSLEHAVVKTICDSSEAESFKSCDETGAPSV